MAGLVPAIPAAPLAAMRFGETCECSADGSIWPHGTLCVGVTSDIARRAYEHREGLVEGFTRRYGLKRLVFMKFHERIIDAIQRETNMKHWRRSRKVRLILDAHPGWLDLYETLNH